MEPALVLIPQTNDNIDRDAYLSECLAQVKEEGFLPVTPEVYRRYMKLEPGQFIEKLIPVCKTIILFIDFGIDETMLKVIDLAKTTNKLVGYRKIIQLDPDKYYMDTFRVLMEVSDLMKVPVEILKSKSRKREYVCGRHIYFRRAREVLGKSISFLKIGAEVNCDHATVMFGIKQANFKNDIVQRYESFYGK